MTLALPAASHRRAALLVHALPKPDREWLLDSLAPRDRVEMEGLLDELRELDIPPDHALLKDVVEAAPQPAAMGAADRLERLSPSQVRLLVEVLRPEPARLVSTLLGLRAWPWRNEVALALGGVEASASTQAPALQQALCEVLWRRLQTGGEVKPAGGRGWGPLSRLLWKGMRR
ncbi:hypothetical protein [Ramlibacter humi]|uniref:Uncharacterized protein n=1 Tax=Ramlibacter humi TaxID=2530451 RepID=A0A4Z0BCW3_9BURK|nr:hypothetical protein [Ramlibacter humi]TFY97082.1 hypothetical protein EZ216_19680 [Ramlibacter humi]